VQDADQATPGADLKTVAFDGVIVGWITCLIFWYIAVSYLGMLDANTAAYLRFSFIGTVCGAVFGLIFFGFIRDSGIVPGAVIGGIYGRISGSL
jgi:hypothetical protein